MITVTVKYGEKLLQDDGCAMTVDGVFDEFVLNPESIPTELILVDVGLDSGTRFHE